MKSMTSSRLFGKVVSAVAYSPANNIMGIKFTLGKQTDCHLQFFTADRYSTLSTFCCLSTIDFFDEFHPKSQIVSFKFLAPSLVFELFYVWSIFIPKFALHFLEFFLRHLDGWGSISIPNLMIDYHQVVSLYESPC